MKRQLEKDLQLIAVAYIEQGVSKAWLNYAFGIKRVTKYDTETGFISNHKAKEIVNSCEEKGVIKL